MTDVDKLSPVLPTVLRMIAQGLRSCTTNNTGSVHRVAFYDPVFSTIRRHLDGIVVWLPNVLAGAFIRVSQALQKIVPCHSIAPQKTPRGC